jgi:hypothetical protein
MCRGEPGPSRETAAEAERAARQTVGVRRAGVTARARAGASRRCGCGLCGTAAGTSRESGGLPSGRAGEPRGGGWPAGWPEGRGVAGGTAGGEGGAAGGAAARGGWPAQLAGGGAGGRGPRGEGWGHGGAQKRQNGDGARAFASGAPT